MRYQLKCGHIGESSQGFADISMAMLCPVDGPSCYGLWPLVAVECREWKITCQTCRYARWTGQSQGMALDLQRKHLHQAHTMHHVTTVDLLTHPDKQKVLRSVFASNRIKTYIVPRASIEGPARYPSVHTVISRDSVDRRRRPTPQPMIRRDGTHETLTEDEFPF